MKNSTSVWTKPELKTVGTLRDVAAGSGSGDQSGGNLQGVGNGKS